ncbi:MAG TPA: hypothetical protein EYM65_10865 [Dehalococcoidia bacterium]|nr:hypothetical protein [Dehalococcoidia bacterium]
MPTQDEEKLLQRRDRALEKMDAGHQALLKSLEDLEPEEAFLGSRWSVWEVLKHLDAPAFVDSLERLMAGEPEMLPPFDTRDAHLKRDIQKLMDTGTRMRNLFVGLSAEQLSRPISPYNPHNSFPSLTMIDLMERVVQHEGNHAIQIDATRKYVAEFSTKDRAVTFTGLGNGGLGNGGLGNGDPSQILPGVREILSFADYIAGDATALDLARPYIRGIELPLNPDNAEEVLSRMGREARAGQWPLVVCLGDPNQTCPELIELAKKLCDKVLVRSGNEG